MFSLLLPIIYLAFISLGLPDSLLGAAWPVMHTEFGVELSYAGILSMAITAGTIVSSILSDRLTRKFGTGRVTAFSVALTSLALFGFSVSHSFSFLLLWAIPYGLGAGGVDAALNNYVAIHYASRHMSWLHCMWGVGTAVSPYCMSFAIGSGRGWNMGYRYISILQMILTVILFLSLPLWQKPKHSCEHTETGTGQQALSIRQVLQISGAKEILITFFCYCALEQTAMLWGSSFLLAKNGIDSETAARLASMFCIGITVGRGINGFLTIRFPDKTLIRMGELLIAAGTAAMLMPFGGICSIGGLILAGFGCAPIYPCIIHSTPSLFGEEHSQAIIGIQMAFAYTGILFMPPLFGVLANNISVRLLPVFLGLLLLLMAVMYEKVLKKSTLSKYSRLARRLKRRESSSI